MGKRGFTSKDGTYKYLEEAIPDVNTDFSIDTDFSDLKETYNKIK